MTRDEAQALLAAYRPSTGDDADPVFAEARALLDTDPILRRWFDQQQAMDASLRTLLQQSPVPDNLLPRLLAGPRATRAGRSWTQPKWLALAASILLLLGAGSLYLASLRPAAPATEFASYRSHLAQWFTEFPALDLEAERLDDIRAWLRARPGPSADFTLPRGLAPFPTIGCRRFQWRDRSATLICFMVEGEAVHVVMLDGAALEGAPAGATPQWGREHGLNVASWSGQQILYVVLTRAPKSTLRRLLAS